jgi:hypothetical protein
MYEAIYGHDNTRFLKFFHAKFRWFEFVYVWVFLENEVFAIINYEILITCPHKKNDIIKFSHLNVVFE